MFATLSPVLNGSIDTFIDIQSATLSSKYGQRHFYCSVKAFRHVYKSKKKLIRGTNGELGSGTGKGYKDMDRADPHLHFSCPRAREDKPIEKGGGALYEPSGNYVPARWLVVASAVGSLDTVSEFSHPRPSPPAVKSFSALSPASASTSPGWWTIALADVVVHVLLRRAMPDRPERLHGLEFYIASLDRSIHSFFFFHLEMCWR
ncbi:hypothetical protein DFH09DRAFT_1089918 [Mycena vulgaris]|nr:hypothetical protein DFH09DRAFT_1089918 [Mycena vulgaris]